MVWWVRVVVVMVRLGCELVGLVTGMDLTGAVVAGVVIVGGGVVGWQ